MDDGSCGMKGTRFLKIIIFTYGILFIFFPFKAELALKSSILLLLKISPILLLVILLTALINYFINPKKLSRHLSRESGIKAWIVALSAGVLSHGPMYAWYPLIEDLKKKGLRDSLIGMFFYARAVKLPLLPIMIGYFGLRYTVILNLYIIAGSILQGLLIEKIEKFRV
jgi:uncharacterized membrane protein YraQ (UPF0718 family)